MGNYDHPNTSQTLLDDFDYENQYEDEDDLDNLSESVPVLLLQGRIKEAEEVSKIILNHFQPEGAINKLKSKINSIIDKAIYKDIPDRIKRYSLRQPKMNKERPRINMKRARM